MEDGGDTAVPCTFWEMVSFAVCHPVRFLDSIIDAIVDLA